MIVRCEVRINVTQSQKEERANGTRHFDKTFTNALKQNSIIPASTVRARYNHQAEFHKEKNPEQERQEALTMGSQVRKRQSARRIILLRF